MNPFEQLNLLQHHQMFDEDINGFIVNKCVGFINPKIAANIDKYVFHCDKDILKGLFFYNIPNGSFCYIKNREEKFSEYDFLFEKIRNFHKYSKNEMEMYKSNLIDIWKDKDVLKKYFKIYDIDKKYYKKYNINIIKTIDNKNEAQKRLF